MWQWVVAKRYPQCDAVTATVDPPERKRQETETDARRVWSTAMRASGYTRSWIAYIVSTMSWSLMAKWPAQARDRAIDIRTRELDERTQVLRLESLEQVRSQVQAYDGRSSTSVHPAWSC